jgi:hypothetical protein
MDIRVTLVDLDGRSGPAVLPDDVPVRRLVAAIVHKLKLPTAAGDGTQLLYNLCLPNGDLIYESLTLAEAWVAKGNVLSLAVSRTNQAAFEILSEKQEFFGNKRT